VVVAAVTAVAGIAAVATAATATTVAVAMSVTIAIAGVVRTTAIVVAAMMAATMTATAVAAILAARITDYGDRAGARGIATTAAIATVVVTGRTIAPVPPSIMVGIREWVYVKNRLHREAQSFLDRSRLHVSAIEIERLSAP
jgi:hypothetical protein